MLILFSVLFLSSFAKANVDKYYFEQISLHEGLSQSTVKAIFRDHMGMLWIGTREGLNRYDGQTIRTYLNDPHSANSLPDNNIFFIAEDANDRLWVGTGGVLCYYDRLSDSFIPEKINDLELSPKNIFVRGDFMYSSTGNTLLIYNSQKQEWTERVFKGLETNLTSACKIEWFDNHHLLIASRWKGLYLCEISTGKLLPPPFNSSKDILDIFIHPEGDIWISEIGKAPQCFDRTGKKIIDLSTYTQHLKADKIMDMCLYNNKIWMVSDGEGILTFDLKSKTIERIKGQNDKHGTAQVNSLISIYPDNYGNLWLGGIRAGLINVKRTFASSFSNSTLYSEWGLSDATVLSFYQDTQNNVWIGTDGQGINLYEPNNEKFTHFPQTFGTKVSSITAFSGEYLLLSIYKEGLKLFHKRTGEFKPFSFTDQRGQNIKTNDLIGLNLFTASNGDVYISDMNLYCYSLDKKDIQQIPLSIKEDGVLRLFTNKHLKNKLIVFGNTSISVIDLRTGKEELALRIPNNYSRIINALEYSADGVFWIGLSSGLLKYDTNTKITSQIMSNRLKSTSTILLDDKNSLWVGSGVSLYRYDTKNDQIFKYEKSDGILANEFLSKAKLLSAQGNVYLGGVLGFTVIQSEIPFPDMAKPQFELLDILLDGTQLESNKITKTEKSTTLKLPWNFTSLQLNFFVNTPALRSFPPFRYAIEGLSPQFLESGTHSVRIQNLKPGSYRILIQYELKNQAWSSPFCIAEIKVLAPWWQAWWFYLLVGLVLLLTLLRVRKSVIAKTKQSMEIDMQRRENDLSEQKIRFLINVSHELRTPLTLIYAPLRRLLTDDNTPKILKPVLTLMYKHVRNMKNMIDMVLDVRKIEKNSDSLNLKSHNFNDWMLGVTDDFAFEFEARNIHLHINRDEKIAQISFDRNRCDKVLSNLLMNAIKFSTDGSTVCVTSELRESCVRVTVADQGSGVPTEEANKLFSRFYQGRHDKGGSGIGLSYAKTQVELHAGKIGYEPAQPQGSVFWFELPLTATLTGPKQIIKSIIREAKPSIPKTIPKLELEFDFKQLSVLIVEDEPELLAYMKESLSEYFAEVITATNGIEAFEKIRKNLPDMLLV